MAPPPTAPGGWAGQAGPGAVGAAPQRDFANFGQRLLAHLIDNVVVAILPIVLLIVGIALAPDVASTCTYGDTYDTYATTYPCMQPDPAVWVPFALVAGLVFLIALFFLVVRPIGVSGQAIGSRVMKIRVVDSKTGMPIGIGRSFARLFVAGIVSGQCCSLGYLWMLFNPNKQTWHDLITSSVVVKA